MIDPSNSASQITEPQYITDPVQIAGILRRLQEGHALIHVSLPGGSESWLSAVIGVQQASGEVLARRTQPARRQRRA
ncbi:MAG: flagellar brake protein [Chromatiales bacterium]|nr:flagellar brake protein [Chromatiales bacterium]